MTEPSILEHSSSTYHCTLPLRHIIFPSKAEISLLSEFDNLLFEATQEMMLAGAFVAS